MTVRDTPSVDSGPAKLKSFDDFDMTLGDMMRGERATLGKSLLDVQRDLKIKVAYIAAIENSDPSAFETQGFVAGYVRSYARYLGMNPETAFETFCKESGFVTANGMAAGASSTKARNLERSKRTGLDPLIDSRTPYLPEVAGRFSEFDGKAVASVGVLLVLVAGIGWGGWSMLQEIQRVSLAPVAQTPGVTSTIDPMASVADLEIGPAYEVGNATGPSQEALDRLYQPRALELPVMVARDGPISAVDPDKVGALAEFVVPPEIESVPNIAPDLIETAIAAAVEDPVVQVVEASPPEVILFAVRPAWVRVQSANGTVLFEKILDAGERYQVPLGEAPARLRAGNSGSVYFEIDGKTYGPAGDSAAVAKNIALGHDELLNSYQIANVEEDPALKRVVELAEPSETQSGE